MIWGLFFMSDSSQNNNQQTSSNGAHNRANSKLSPMAAILKILKDNKLDSSLSSRLLSKKSVLVMLAVIVVLLVIMVLQTIAIITISQSKTPEPIVLATTQDGGVKRVLTLSSPNISMRGLTNKVAVDVGYCLTFDTNTHEAVAEYCRLHVFTAPGYQTFQKAIDSSPIGEPLKTARPFVIDSSVVGIPILTNEGRYLFGSDSVEIEAPVFIKTEVLGVKPTLSKYIARVRLVQVKNPESTNAYKINEIYVARVNESR